MLTRTSYSQWFVGLVLGVTGGFGVGRYMRFKTSGVTAVSATGAALCSLYGQWLANAPCLCELLVLDSPSSAYARSAEGGAIVSPLAQQARRILAVGGKETVRAIQQQQADEAFRGKVHAQLPAGAVGSDGIEDSLPGAAPAASGNASNADSWADVRRRYRERGDGGVAAVAPGNRDAPKVRRNAYGDIME